MLQLIESFEFDKHWTFIIRDNNKSVCRAYLYNYSKSRESEIVISFVPSLGVVEVNDCFKNNDVMNSYNIATFYDLPQKKILIETIYKYLGQSDFNRKDLC